ncbi:MBL fold metallo-hydrolase [Methanoculleus sp.]|uniref:MBL fold metallo-hydrolase n=1 Tax=Methanoculleus sp. TaxID=90427 RepID=UPI0026259B2F|nr:MBL fold metallo-hydrolase [Methanoculleus sp.]MDI6867638.1 MBL fold metallo-hydrolase [Methanoculleus sp.]
MFTITEVYNNIPFREGLTTDWGFSCLVEEGGLLFDTGAKGDVLTSNMRALGIDPAKIRSVVLSHDHHDHVGGFASILDANPGVEVFVHSAFSRETLERISDLTAPQIVRGWTEVTDGVAVTGPLGTTVQEQSLVLTTPAGYLIITGCAHPHIARIIERVSQEGRVRGVIGGLHSLSPRDLKELARLDCISASHCTENIAHLQERYPASFRAGGVGCVHRV